ncbi:MAG: class flavin-dependent oxidoreductase [Ilumatobacteraceae bacterium]|nr:class flavin-dependent oxidoreductase [Ilumatobacteraceae bacterium]
MTKSLHIGISIDGAGQHPGAWRDPRARPERLFTAEHTVELARLAERGVLDYVSLDDSFRLRTDRTDHVRGQLDALLTLARVAPQTASIGLVPTVTTTHTEPFHVSKNLATLDFVSLGRAGWLVDVSTTEAEAFHFGRRTVAGPADLYAEAGEAIDVVSQLWDSWEDDAVIRDIGTGRYIDRDKLHVTNFEGKYFSVRGPSITPRSPQGQPIVVVDAVNELALEVGIERADVILIHAASITDAAATRERIRRGLVGVARAPDDVAVLAVIDVQLADTNEAAAAMRAQLDAWGGRLPASALEHIGTSQALADLLEAWAAAGVVDGFHVRPATLPDTLERFVDDVVPVLQQRGVLRTEYVGTTLRDHFGLERPANRYATTRAHGGT